MAENMIKAGRAGLTFGGDWDETVEYNRLVGVRYDNKLFFSKKTVPVGTIPEDGEYWFLSYEGLTDEQYEALLNGTQQVGDSAKLGGKDASEYVLGEGSTLLTAFPNGITSNSTMQDLLNALGNRTILHVRADKPLVPENYSTLTVFKYGANYVLAFAKSQLSNILYYGSIGGDSSWSGWKSPFTTEGGMINSDAGTPLRLNRTDDTGSGTTVMIDFLVNGSRLGMLGFTGANTPVFRLAESANYYRLLHTGNKPTGTYTGNGDATEREIATGGIGNRASVSTGNGMAILSQHGATIVPADGSTPFWSPDYTFADGVITLKGTHKVLNLDGGQYRYQVE